MSAPPKGSSSRKLSYVDPATFTPHYRWEKSKGSSSSEEVVCENVPLARIAQEFSTPTYVYSRAAIAEAFGELQQGLGKLPHSICFAMKSNGNVAILKQLAKLGAAFDVVSGGELALLQHAGVSGDRVVFSGVGKSREEMREALRYPARKHGGRAGIKLFNIESAAELEVLMEESALNIARGGGVPAVSIRVNPDVQAGGHPHISTGRHDHKFGLDWNEARRLYLRHRKSAWFAWQGISAHIGSQIVTQAPFQRALKRVIGYVKDLRREGIALRFLDFGGGLGVRYTCEQVPSRKAYARMIAKMVRPLGVHLLLEPGRTIVAPAGVLLTRVTYTKDNRGKTFVIVDAGMNDLLRPALYGAAHPITRVTRDAKESAGLRKRVDVVGPVCETGDCFLRDWPMGEAKAGDLLAIWTAGAYGMSLASNYNVRGRPAEVLVEGSRARLIRRRETHKDLVQFLSE
ncbi:MAG: diaminopimelate decarboxylase [Candidatus Acidiferrum sp.]